MQTVIVDNTFIQKINSLIRIELAYERLTKGKRKFGITGEVGELLACNQLGLSFVLNSRSEGFDAIDENGKKVEIKTRRSETADLPRDTSRTSKFADHKFDYALLVILDNKYRLYEIWKASYKKLLPVIQNNKRRNPSLRSFKNVALASKEYSRKKV